MNCLEGFCKELLPEIDISKEQGKREEDEKCTRNSFLDCLSPPFIQAAPGRTSETRTYASGNNDRLRTGCPFFVAMSLLLFDPNRYKINLITNLILRGRRCDEHPLN